MRLAHAGMEGERKPVTILFIDIVGSTSLAEKLDPEEWREIINGAHQRVSLAVYRYEGTIAQLLGDGVLAFFGAPITHEDDPLRSVQAAIDIQDAIRSYADTLQSSVPDLKVRIGINTGTVVVGNIGDNLHMEYLAIGDAVNLAARLQSAAEPGGILLSHETKRSLEHAIELKELGEITVKGRQESVRAYQVIRVKEIHGHGRKLMNGGKNLLVGRQSEMRTLLKTSTAVQAGLGRAVVLIGEPGVGKTRLMHEWKEKDPKSLRWITGECLSYGQELPYYLINSWLRNLLDIPDNAAENKLKTALRHLTENLFGDVVDENLVFLSHLLSISLSEAESRYLQGLNPQGIQVQYLETLRRLLLALAKHQPLALVFEDIHWADPSSVTILSKLLPLAKEAPLLFCFIGRPEPSVPGWGLVESCRTTLGGILVEITLQSLADTEVQELVVNLLDGEKLPSVVQELVLERAEGNPLFVEELISLLIEKGILVREAGGLRASREFVTLTLPENLVRLMLARIDRLPEEPKRTLRVASVIGRQFLASTLKDVLQRIGQAETQSRLLSQLGELEIANLVQLAATQPEISYLFRHALVQEAVYEAVLKSDRRGVHRATAEALENAFPDRLDDLAPTLAYHFERGEARQKAIYYLERAGDRANHTYANTEALALYQAAIKQADSLLQKNNSGTDPLPGVQLRMKLGDILVRVGQHETARLVYEDGLAHLSEDQVAWRAQLLDRIGNAWIIPRQYSKAIEAYRSAEAALGGISMESQSSYFSQWLDLQLDYLSAYYWMNDVLSMKNLIERLEPVIEISGTALQRARYYLHLIEMELRRNRYWPDELTIQHCLQAVAAAQEAGDLATLGMLKFAMGFCHVWHMELNQAETCLKDVLSLAERIGDMELRVLCSTYLTITYRKKKSVEAVKYWAERSLALAREADMSFYCGVALGNQSWVSFMQGDVLQAEEYTRQARRTDLNNPTMPLKFVYLWPVLAISLSKDLLDQANETAEEIIHPSQTRIPESLEALLSSGIDLYKNKKWDQSKKEFETAVKMAIDSSYF